MNYIGALGYAGAAFFFQAARVWKTVRLHVSGFRRTVGSGS